MRQIEIIKKDIERVEDEIREKKMLKAAYMTEYCEAVQTKFEEQLNIKQGDKVKTDFGNVFIFNRIVFEYGMFYALCYFPKKDGSASKIKKYVLLEDLGFSSEI